MVRWIWLLLSLTVCDSICYYYSDKSISVFHLHIAINLLVLLSLAIYSMIELKFYWHKEKELVLFFSIIAIVSVCQIAEIGIEFISYNTTSEVLNVASIWIKTASIIMLAGGLLYKLIQSILTFIKEKSSLYIIIFAILVFPAPVGLALTAMYSAPIENIPKTIFVAQAVEAIMLAILGVLAMFVFSLHFELELKYAWIQLSISSVILIIGELGLMMEGFLAMPVQWIFKGIWLLSPLLLFITLVTGKGGLESYKSLSKLIKERDQYHFLNQELSGLIKDIGIMTQMLRHDLINDFAVIESFVDLYIETKNEELLKKIKKRLTEASSRLQTVQSSTDIFIGLGLKPIDITELEKIGRFFSNVTVKIPAKKLFVLGNQVLFTAIYNIINNAFQHAGSNVEVNIEVKEKNKENAVQIIIADNGVGISNEDKKRIFLPGYKGRNSKGEGIALALIKQYIERLGGTITVEDNKPRGAKFVITLPKLKV